MRTLLSGEEIAFYIEQLSSVFMSIRVVYSCGLVEIEISHMDIVVHCTVYDVYRIVYIVQCTMYNVRCTLHSGHWYIFTFK